MSTLSTADCIIYSVVSYFHLKTITPEVTSPYTKIIKVLIPVRDKDILIINTLSSIPM